MTYPNKRDCRHGRQRGHCVECELEACEAENAKLTREIARLRAQGAEPVAWLCTERTGAFTSVTNDEGEMRAYERRGRVIQGLYTHPQPAQQGGVPEKVTYREVSGNVKIHNNCWQPHGIKRYVDGWNAAIDAMLSTNTTSPGSEWRVASSITGSLPDLGVPVIGHNPAWINEDFNPRGIRECFRTGDGTEWVNAFWWDEQDCYEAKDGAPTLWQPYPQPPREQGVKS